MAIPTGEVHALRERNPEANWDVPKLLAAVDNFKRRWHATRRYLRAANKGCEHYVAISRSQGYRIRDLLAQVDKLEGENEIARTLLRTEQHLRLEWKERAEKVEKEMIGLRAQLNDE